jgi:hypothetical protein
MTRHPKEPQLINWSLVSERLTGSKNNIKHVALPKRFIPAFKELNDYVKSWINKNKEV